MHESGGNDMFADPTRLATQAGCSAESRIGPPPTHQGSSFNPSNREIKNRRKKRREKEGGDVTSNFRKIFHAV